MHEWFECMNGLNVMNGSNVVNGLNVMNVKLVIWK